MCTFICCVSVSAGERILQVRSNLRTAGLQSAGNENPSSRGQFEVERQQLKGNKTFIVIITTKAAQGRQIIIHRTALILLT